MKNSENKKLKNRVDKNKPIGQTHWNRARLESVRDLAIFYSML